MGIGCLCGYSVTSIHIYGEMLGSGPERIERFQALTFFRLPLRGSSSSTPARTTSCAPNDGLPVGRVTRTLAHTAEHENNKRCGRHIWLQWTMIVGGKAPLPQRMFGTVHQASRL